MRPIKLDLCQQYYQGFSISECFRNYRIGMQTGSNSRFRQPSKEGLREQLMRENGGQDVQGETIQPCLIRPFDTHFVYYVKDQKTSRSLHPKISYSKSYRPRYETLSHLLQDNVALLVPRQIVTSSYQHVFCTRQLVDACAISNTSTEQNQVFPLYLYENGQKILNIREGIINQFHGITDENAIGRKIFDYIYAVLHSVNYRTQFFSFRSFELPRIPYPKNKEIFEALAEKGETLQDIHLLRGDIFAEVESNLRDRGGRTLSESLSVTQARPKAGTLKEANKLPDWNKQIWINNSQYFDDISEDIWNFYIGGYQPARKWIEARKGISLRREDLSHYAKIIRALAETGRIMREIDEIGVL